MKSVAWAMVAVLLVGSVAGCAGGVVAPVTTPGGLIITMTTAPLSTNMAGAKAGTKRGSASCVNILGLFAFGDAGVDAAIRSAGIQTVSYADYRCFSMLLLFNAYTTVVYGE